MVGDVGPVGETGLPGAPGYPGRVGIKGFRGERGKTVRCIVASELYIIPGTITWPASLKSNPFSNVVFNSKITLF